MNIINGNEMNKKEKKQLILDFINGPLREYLDGGQISFGKFKEKINETCGTDFAYSELYPSYLFNAQLIYEEADLFDRIDMEEGGRQEECKLVIPGTFIACGEGVGKERHYCSKLCYEKSKEKENGSME